MSSSTEPSAASPAPPRLRVCVEAKASADDQDWVYRSLTRHSAQATGITDHVPLNIFLRDPDGQLQGGLLGWTLWSWMHIDSVFVAEAHRRQGCGRQLLTAAERAARIRGCTVIEVQTFSFLSLSFYQNAGYTVFGTLTGIGRGKFERYYLKKEV